MPKWLKFSAPYDHRPTFEQVTSYPAGATFYVVNEIADAAIEAGAAVETEKPEGGIEDDDAEAADQRGSSSLAGLDGPDAHRGAVRVELRDAASGERLG